MCRIHSHLSTLIETAQTSTMGQKHAAALFCGNHPIAVRCNETSGHAEGNVIKQCILRKDR